MHVSLVPLQFNPLSTKHSMKWLGKKKIKAGKAQYNSIFKLKHYIMSLMHYDFYLIFIFAFIDFDVKGGINGG